jgi:hypothetical protein
MRRRSSTPADTSMNAKSVPMLTISVDASVSSIVVRGPRSAPTLAMAAA